MNLIQWIESEKDKNQLKWATAQTRFMYQISFRGCKHLLAFWSTPAVSRTQENWSGQGVIVAGVALPCGIFEVACGDLQLVVVVLNEVEGIALTKFKVSVIWIWDLWCESFVVDKIASGKWHFV